MDSNKIKKLTDLFGPGQVITNPEKLVKYITEGFLEGCTPACAVKPKDGFEVEKLVKFANEEDIKLVPVSSCGKHYSGGSAPAVKDVVIVDLSENKVIYDADRTFRIAVIDAGVTYEELIPFLKEKGLAINMPLAPKAGKSVAASLLEIEPKLNPNLEWNIMDPLRSTEVIWGDGNRMRTGEAAGLPLDLNTADAVKFAHEKKHQYLIGGNGPDTIDYYRLLARSQGTMGIVPWITLKCALLPDLTDTWVAGSDKLNECIEFAYQMERLRCGDGFFILNAKDMAALMADTSEEAEKLSKELPAWIAAVKLESRPPIPQMRLDAQKECMEIAAQKAGIRLSRQVAGLRAEDIIGKAFTPCREGNYWKEKETGTFAEVFFLCTMDRTGEFIEIMKKEAKKTGYPIEDLGIYIQPRHQGVSCMLSFRLPYDKNTEEAAKNVFNAAPKALFDEGAFFSRPYGDWAKVQLPMDKGTTDRLIRLKGIFDPNNVLNPGHLSDWAAKEQ